MNALSNIDMGEVTRLTQAGKLAEADGGRLEMLQAQPPVFGLFLSRTPLKSAVPDDDEPMVR